MKQDDLRARGAELFGHGILPTSGQDEMGLLADLWRALRRSWLWIAAIGFFAGVVAYAFSYSAEVRFTSVAQVMIDTREVPDAEYTPFVSGLPTSVTALESELEVLRSYDIIEAVVNRMDLMNDPEFAPGEMDEPVGLGDLIGMVRGTVQGVFVADAEPGAEDIPGFPSSRDPALDATVGNVASRRSVEQVGNMSAVFAISFTSNDPDKAAALANSLAEEYLATQRTAKLQSLERSQGWLTARSNEMKEVLADLGVELESHILDAPFSTEQVQTINANRVSAENRYGQNRLRLNEVERSLRQIELYREEGELVAAAREVPTATAVLSSAIVAAEAGEQGAMAALEQELDVAVERMHGERDRLDALLRGLRVDIESMKDDLRIQARHDAQTRRIENDIRVSETIYENFMSQLARRIQQDQFLDADARIISVARPSVYPSEPQRARMALGAALFMVFLASGVVVAREWRQDRLRTVAEIEDCTGLPLVATIPEVPRRHAPFQTFLHHDGRLDPSLLRFARKLHSSILSEVEPDRSENPPPTYQRSSRHARGTSLRNARGLAERKTQARKARDCRVIAGASACAGEGQSTMLLMLGTVMAASGKRVLILDCDLWRSPYRDIVGPDAPDLAGLMADPVLAEDSVLESSQTGLHLLAPAPGGNADVDDLSSNKLDRMVAHFAGQYDYILLDVPPLLEVIDASPVYRLAHCIVLAVRWNSTSEGAVRSAIRALHDVGASPTAVVASRVKLRRARAYGDDYLVHARQGLLTRYG